MVAAERFDDMLMGMAHQTGGIKPLLDTFFSFLHRNTDFYVELDPSKKTAQRMGFPPGAAEKMLLEAFKKYPLKTLSNTATTIPNNNNNPAKTLNKNSPTSSSSLEKIRYTDAGLQVPIGNGGTTSEGITWTQSSEDLTITIKVPRNTRAKDIVCNVKPSSIQVGLNQQELLLSGPLSKKVKSDESLWSLEANDTLSISLEKVIPTWWNSILTTDTEKIDTSMVDSTRNVSDYDDKTQGAIRKIMFDREQVARGLPTSEELETAAILEKATNLPSSPFLK